MVIVGRPDADDTRCLVRATRSLFLPHKVVVQVPPGGGLRAPAGHMPLLAALEMIDGHATAYVCQHTACSMPSTSAEELVAQLRGTATA